MCGSDSKASESVPTNVLERKPRAHWPWGVGLAITSRRLSSVSAFFTSIVWNSQSNSHWFVVVCFFQQLSCFAETVCLFHSFACCSFVLYLTIFNTETTKYIRPETVSTISCFSLRKSRSSYWSLVYLKLAKGTTILKSYFVQQGKEIEAKPCGQGSCLKMLVCFYIRFLNVASLMTSNGTDLYTTMTGVPAHPCCTQIPGRCCVLTSPEDQNQKEAAGKR